MDWSMRNIDLSFRMHFQVVSWVVHKYSHFFFQKIKKSENKKGKKLKNNQYMLEWSMESIDLTIRSYFQDVSWVFQISIMFFFLNNINPKIKLTINIKKTKDMHARSKGSMDLQ